MTAAARAPARPRATRRADGAEVAVKIITKGAKEKEDARIQVEVDILRRVRHPNLIQLYDVFDSPDSLYLVMQLCRGGELFDRIIARKKVRGAGRAAVGVWPRQSAALRR